MLSFPCKSFQALESPELQSANPRPRASPRVHISLARGSHKPADLDSSTSSHVTPLVDGIYFAINTVNLGGIVLFGVCTTPRSTRSNQHQLHYPGRVRWASRVRRLGVSHARGLPWNNSKRKKSRLVDMHEDAKGRKIGDDSQSFPTQITMPQVRQPRGFRAGAWENLRRRLDRWGSTENALLVGESVHIGQRHRRITDVRTGLAEPKFLSIGRHLEIGQLSSIVIGDKSGTFYCLVSLAELPGYVGSWGFLLKSQTTIGNAQVRPIPGNTGWARQFCLCFPGD